MRFSVDEVFGKETKGHFGFEKRFAWLHELPFGVL